MAIKIPARLYTLWLGLLITAAIMSYGIFTRLEHYHTAVSAPHTNTAPIDMMATVDAYYYLRWARADIEGSYHPDLPDPLRHYQRIQYANDTSYWYRSQNSPQWMDQRQPKTLPALSRLLSFISLLSPAGLDRIAIVLPPILSGLFMFPVFLYGWRLGYPAAGVMGAGVGALCLAYYSRSGAGWLDTDVLNMFFPWMIAYLILLMSPLQTRTRRLLLALAAGLAMNAFHIWYERPGFAIVFLLVMAAYLVIQRLGSKEVALSAVVFIVAANPEQYLGGFESLKNFLSSYIVDVNAIKPSSSYSFPSVMETVSEVRGIHWFDVFGSILQPSELAILGVAGFVLLALSRWQQLLPLTPMLLLSLLAFISSPRFAMYIGPVVGLGLGYIFTVLVHAALSFRNVQTNETTDRFVSSELLVYVIVTMTISLWLLPGTVDRAAFEPAVRASIYNAIDEVGGLLPDDARLWTWWDTGYMIPYVAGLGVYHDGGAQKSPQTYFVARSLVDQRQENLSNLVAFVDRYGNKGIQQEVERRGSIMAAISHIESHPISLDDEGVYLFFTADMIGKFAAINHVGGWSFETGAPEVARYTRMPCSGANIMRLLCESGEVDLRAGRVGGNSLLRGAELIESGRIVQSFDYPDNKSQTYLQILLKRGLPYAVFSLPEAIYYSNFNQIYLLGRFDGALFEEVYNGFPHARAFRVKRVSQSTSP